MHKVKQSAASTRKFVSKHRVALTVGATTLVMLRLQMKTAAEWNAFLKEHDLFDVYYAMDEV